MDQEEIIRIAQKDREARSEQERSYLVQYILRIPFFQKFFEDKNMYIIEQTVNKMNYQLQYPNTYIIRYQSIGNVSVYMPQQQQRNSLKLKKNLGQNSILGQISLIQNELTSATIKTNEICYFLYLKRDDFEQVLRNNDEIIFKQEFRFWKNLFDQNMNFQLANQLTQKSKNEQFELNQFVFREGEQIQGVYFVKSGEFLQEKMIDNKQKKVCLYNDNSIIGADLIGQQGLYNFSLKAVQAGSKISFLKKCLFKELIIDNNLLKKQFQICKDKIFQQRIDLLKQPLCMSKQKFNLLATQASENETRVPIYRPVRMKKNLTIIDRLCIDNNRSFLKKEKNGNVKRLLSNSVDNYGKFYRQLSYSEQIKVDVLERFKQKSQILKVYEINKQNNAERLQEKLLQCRQKKYSLDNLPKTEIRKNSFNFLKCSKEKVRKNTRNKLKNQQIISTQKSTLILPNKINNLKIRQNSKNYFDRIFNK